MTKHVKETKGLSFKDKNVSWGREWDTEPFNILQDCIIKSNYTINPINYIHPHIVLIFV